MKKALLALVIGMSLFTVLVSPAHSQMVGTSSVSTQLSEEDKQDIQLGGNLYQQFHDKKIACQTLAEDDFEKIGEYLMQKRLGSESQHAFMDKMMKQRMGEAAEKQMHIQIGKSETGCFNGRGGARTMMGWNYGNMMGGYGWGFGFLGLVLWVVLLIDLILLGAWLWKNITHKR